MYKLYRICIVENIALKYTFVTKYNLIYFSDIRYKKNTPSNISRYMVKLCNQIKNYNCNNKTKIQKYKNLVQTFLF